MPFEIPADLLPVNLAAFDAYLERMLAPEGPIQVGNLARELAHREGIMVGHSSGAALWGVRETARRMDRGVIVTVLADGGNRYLSSGLYGRHWQ